MQSPKGSTNYRPDVRIATAAEFLLVNHGKQGNFINGEVDSGVLTFIVENMPKNTPQDGCRGSWMFDQMWAHFGASVNVIVGLWIGPNSDNLNEYNRQVAQGRTNEEAAWATWTGQRAREKGFTHVRVVRMDPPSGSPFSRIEVKFS